MVLVAGFVSHLMLDWTERRHAHFLSRLGTFSRLIRFDKRGTGMSDRPGSLPDLETRMGDVAAVMEAARCERAVLFGYSEGGPMSILYAATYPERVSALAIYSSYARRLWAPDYPWGFRPEERARYAVQLEQDWAFEADMRRMCPNADEDLARWWGERCRAATSPGAARALIEMASLIDVRERAAAVHAPTLVLHRRDDIDAARRRGPLPGRPHPRRHVRRARRHRSLRRGRPRPDPRPGRGVRPWSGVVGAGRTSLTTLLAVHADEADGHGLAARDRGGVARRCSAASLPRPSRPACWPPSTGRSCGRAAASRSPSMLPRRASVSVGLHTAEVARRGVHVSGDGVAVAQAVADRAVVGEVWATSTVRDLAADSRPRFEPRAELRVPSLGRMVELVAVS